MDLDPWKSDREGEGEGHAATSTRSLADQSPICNIQGVVQPEVLLTCRAKMATPSDQETRQGTGLPTQALI